MIRKQYHFRPSKRGLLAWDIHRLIEMSKHFPVIEVKLSDIRELDETYWFDHEGDKPTCRVVAEHARLMREVNMNHPVILFSDGRVADGMHRICRGLIDGVPTIKAVRFPTDPEPDYVGKAPDELPY